MVLSSSAEPPPGPAEVKVAFTAGSEHGEAATRIDVLPARHGRLSTGPGRFGVGSFDRAIADFTEAIRLDPSSFEAQLHRGISHVVLAGRSRDAVADYTAAIQLRPDHPEAYLDRAKV